MIKINLFPGPYWLLGSPKHQRKMNPLMFLAELSADNLRRKVAPRHSTGFQVDGSGAYFSPKEDKIEWIGPDP